MRAFRPVAGGMRSVESGSVRLAIKPVRIPVVGASALIPSSYQVLPVLDSPPSLLAVIALGRSTPVMAADVFDGSATTIKATLAAMLRMGGVLLAGFLLNCLSLVRHGSLIYPLQARLIMFAAANKNAAFTANKVGREIPVTNPLAAQPESVRSRAGRVGSGALPETP